MLREFLGKKAADAVDKSRYGETKVGKVAAVILDDDRLLENEQERFFSEHHKFTGSVFSGRTFVLALIANLISWASVLLIPNIVAKLVIVLTLLLPKGGLLLVAPAFGFTMMAVYTGMRKFFPEVEEDESTDVMQSYNRQSESLLTWKLWVFSCGIAAVDSILLMVVYLTLSDNWES